MNNKPYYSEYTDTIIALVLFLGMTEDMTKQLNWLVKKLSLDYDETLFVLQNFKGLFRKSNHSNGELQYDLHIRYAQRWRENDIADQNQPPLEANYMEVLLNFVSNMVANEEAEKRQRSANLAATRAAYIAAIGAGVAAFIGIISIGIQLAAG